MLIHRFACRTALLRVFLPGLLLALSPLAADVGRAAVLSYNVTGDLLGTQSLQQFDPTIGTLTGVSFTLTSTLAGLATGTGNRLPGIPPFPGTCVPGLPSTINVSAMGGVDILLPPASLIIPGGGNCDAVPFSFPENSSVAAAGPLTSYLGTGTLPFTFSASASTALQTLTWNGTVQVDYTYDALVAPPAPVPEPSTALLAATALATLAAFKRRR